MSDNALMKTTIEMLEFRIESRRRALKDYQESMTSYVADGRYRQVAAMATEAFGLQCVIEQLECALASLRAADSSPGAGALTNASPAQGST